MNTDTDRDEERRAEGTEAEAGTASEPETVEGLRARLDELDALRAEAEERSQRARADYQNLKRRTQSDFEAMLRRQVQPMLESLLLVLDHLEMALAIPTESPDAKSLAEGVRLTRDQLVRALEEEGVHAVPEVGPFDPAVHQAVATATDTEVAPGEIVQTIRRGFTWNGIVLRPGQVRVAAGEAAPEQHQDSQSEGPNTQGAGKSSLSADSTEISMPTYRYLCNACGQDSEFFQSMTEGPKRKCPACGRNKLERQIGTGAAILFRGSGFYQTDYRSSSYREGARAEGKAGKGGDAATGSEGSSKGSTGTGGADKADGAKS